MWPWPGVDRINRKNPEKYRVTIYLIVMQQGKFIVSLDFEMMWGVRDKRTIASYGNNISAVRRVIPRLIEMADKSGVHLTFGVVGMMMLKNKDELLNSLPSEKPSYVNIIRSPYGQYIEAMTKEDESYHFAPDMVAYIRQHPKHEIGSHTFCHYYCLEEGQSLSQFEADLAMAQKVSDVPLRSIIFPRNQTNSGYLAICHQQGFNTYRGNEKNKLNKAAAHDGIAKRALRLIDNYINITGSNTYTDVELLNTGVPMNIPASRFLRPYNSKLRMLDGLRLHRIKKAMTHAAKNGETYHIWWHPHNFGAHTEENFEFLAKIFEHYRVLTEKYGMRSYTFSELFRVLHK